MATSSSVVGLIALVTSVAGVFITSPSNSSLGEKLNVGSNHELIVRMASSRCSGQFFGVFCLPYSIHLQLH